MIDQRKWTYLSRDEVKIVEVKDEETGVVTDVLMPMQFIRGNFADRNLPKMVLARLVTERCMEEPVFGFEVHDKYYIGFVKIDGVVYKSRCIEKSRRYSEQVFII